MPKPDSLRLKKEALQCETAAKLADFLESYVPHRCYDFTLPDLLSFKCDETLAELRKISTWQTLEIDLILATIAVSALLGASIGWFYPWFNFPVLSRPDDTTADR
jgi:hypothetical protein